MTTQTGDVYKRQEAVKYEGDGQREGRYGEKAHGQDGQRKVEDIVVPEVVQNGRDAGQNMDVERVHADLVSGRVPGDATLTLGELEALEAVSYTHLLAGGIGAGLGAFGSTTAAQGAFAGYNLGGLAGSVFPGSTADPRLGMMELGSWAASPVPKFYGVPA